MLICNDNLIACATRYPQIYPHQQALGDAALAPIWPANRHTPGGARGALIPSTYRSDRSLTMFHVERLTVLWFRRICLGHEVLVDEAVVY